jgi:hypothetical protein
VEREASEVVAEREALEVVAADPTAAAVAVASAAVAAAMAGASSRKPDLYLPTFEGLAVAAPQNAFCPVLALL